MLNKIKEYWLYLQSLAELNGGLYVDAFAIVILVRMWAVLHGYPALTPQEAGLWAVTIGAFAYSNKGGPKQS